MAYIGAGVSRFNTADSLTVSGTAEVTGASTLTGAVTANAGVTVGTATIDSNGDIKLADSDVLYLGSGLDLQIQHNGSGSFITDAGTGDLHLRTDTNLNIQNAAGSENKAVFATDGAVTLYHDNAAKIATTSTGVDVTGSVYADLIRHNDDTDTFIQWPGNNTLAFNTGGSERIRITSGGNIGINETNPTLMLSLQTGVSMGLGDLSDYSTKGILGNIHSSISSQSLGSTSVDDARNLGFGSTYVPSAGGTKPTSYGTIRCFEHYNGNLNKGARYISQLAVGHANNPAWYARNSNTTDGTSFGTWYQLDMTSTSDERSKENVEDAPDQLAVVKQFQVKEFDYIDNADEPRQLGMMAQHVDTFAPEYVTKDDEDPDIMWRIKYNKMVPMLVKALQEATTKIETLETEMTALKARVTALEGN